ncbi:MAG: hypothetical protein KatS3mg012_1096 [Gaiellaceae bacterium]|nr:MAG: hypothetical protein KatS3mg012_1096 [Gaiellaceae bacterium]
MKPTRSAKRTETRRRSAAGAAVSVALSASRGACAASAFPHSPQNLTPGGFGVPQEGQASAREAPHSPQNLRPASFAVPQAGQGWLATAEL